MGVRDILVDQGKKLASSSFVLRLMSNDRVMKVAKMVRKNVRMTSVTFHTRSIPRRSWTMTECRNAVAVNHGSRQGDWKTIARSAPGSVTCLPSMITPPYVA